MTALDHRKVDFFYCFSTRRNRHARLQVRKSQSLDEVSRWRCYSRLCIVPETGVAFDERILPVGDLEFAVGYFKRCI